MFSTNLHADYHTPRDEPERIDYAKLTRMTQWFYLTGWLVANTDRRPAARHGVPARAVDCVAQRQRRIRLLDRSMRPLHTCLELRIHSDGRSDPAVLRAHGPRTTRPPIPCPALPVPPIPRNILARVAYWSLVAHAVSNIISVLAFGTFLVEPYPAWLSQPRTWHAAVRAHVGRAAHRAHRRRRRLRVARHAHRACAPRGSPSR